MIQFVLSLIAVLPQADDRIDFSLESGVILVAAVAFVLINLLLAAVLYPYFQSNSSEDEGGQNGTHDPSESGPVGDVAAHDEEELEQRVDDFLEDIHRERSG